MNNEKGYYRCGKCDYCALSTENENRTFSLDKKEDIYLCSKCMIIIGDTLSEFGFSDDEISQDEQKLIANAQPGNSWRSEKKTGRELLRERLGSDYKIWKERSKRPNPGSPPKVTLPKVTGVNDGPVVDLDKEDKK